MLCRGCGQRLVEDAQYCHRCGMRVLADRQESGSRDPRFAEADAETFGIDPAADRPGDAACGTDDYDVWDGRFSVKAMYGLITLSFACTVAACLAALLLLVRSGLRDALLMLAVVPAIWLFAMVQIARKKMRARYRLTPHQVVVRLGWLGRTRRELALSDVADVTVRQNPIEQFLEVGSLEVCARSGAKHNLRLVGIDDPTGVADRIMSRVQSTHRSEPVPAAG